MRRARRAERAGARAKGVTLDRSAPPGRGREGAGVRERELGLSGTKGQGKGVARLLSVFLLNLNF
jgi:hypothetical protein